MIIQCGREGNSFVFIKWPRLTRRTRIHMYRALCNWQSVFTFTIESSQRPSEKHPAQFSSMKDTLNFSFFRWLADILLFLRHYQDIWKFFSQIRLPIFVLHFWDFAESWAKIFVRKKCISYVIMKGNEEQDSIWDIFLGDHLYRHTATS